MEKNTFLLVFLISFSAATGTGLALADLKLKAVKKAYENECLARERLASDLATCRRQLSAKEKGIRFNKIADTYERLEWVPRDFFALDLKEGDTILTYPMPGIE